MTDHQAPICACHFRISAGYDPATSGSRVPGRRSDVSESHRGFRFPHSCQALQHLSYLPNFYLRRRVEEFLTLNSNHRVFNRPGHSSRIRRFTHLRHTGIPLKLTYNKTRSCRNEAPALSESARIESPPYPNAARPFLHIGRFRTQNCVPVPVLARQASAKALLRHVECRNGA